MSQGKKEHELPKPCKNHRHAWVHKGGGIYLCVKCDFEKTTAEIDMMEDLS